MNAQRLIYQIAVSATLGFLLGFATLIMPGRSAPTALQLRPLDELQAIDDLMLEWRWDEARQRADDLVGEHPGWGPAYGARAVTHLGHSGHWRVRADLRRAQELDPDSPVVHEYACRAAFYWTVPEEMVGHGEAALEGDPDDPHVLQMLSVAYLLLGRHDDAIQAWESSREELGADTRARCVAAHSLIYSGEYDEAEEQLASLSASHPNHMYAVVLAAQLRAERGRGRSRAASALANAFGIDGRRTAETLDSPLIEGGRDRLIAVLQQVYALRPDDPWPRLSLAHHLAAEGRREAALKALPGLRDLDDAHAIVRYRHVLLSLDQDMEAYTAAQRAAKLAPDSDLAIYGALLALTELDRWGEAAEAAQRFVSLAEGTPEAYAAAGALMGAETPAGFRRGQAILDEGLRHYPAAPGILRWKAHGLHEAGRPADAAEAYSRLREADPEDLKAAAWLATTFADAGRTDKAIEEATRAMQQSPDSSVILRSRTYAHHTAEDYPSALAFYDRAVQADPLNAKALLARSMSRRRMNDAEGARRDEDRAIDLAGHHPEVYLSAAEGHGAVDSERRHEILRRGVEAHPYHMELRYALAWSYRDAGLERAARQTARAAIDVTSDAPLDQAWRATFLEAHLDDTDAAIDAGQRAVEGRPWDPEVVTDQAFRLSEVGRVDEAKALLLRAIETTPEAVGPHAVLGMLEQERGRWAESEAALSRALEIYEGYRGHPEHVTSLHAWRAEARLEMSAYAEALADAEAAIELGGEYAEYYRLRAEAHEGLGQATEARADRERASQLSPLEREHVWTRPS